MSRKLPKRVEQRLIHRCLSGDTPLVVGSRRTSSIAIAQHLHRLDVEVSKVALWGRNDDEKEANDHEPGLISLLNIKRHRIQTQFRIEREPITAHMMLRVPDDEYPISDLDELTALVVAIQEYADKEAAREQRYQKRDLLRRQAITAQVTQLAKEHDFEFEIKSIEHTAKGHIKLLIKTASKKVIALNIPLNKYGKLPENLGEIVVNMIALYESGIRFKLEDA